MRAWLLAALCLAPAACLDERAGPPFPEGGRLPRGWVLVRLAEGETVELSCAGDWTARTPDGEDLGGGRALPADTVLSPAATGLSLGPLELRAPTVELRPARDGDLRVGERAYRGLLRLERLPGRPGSAARVRVLNLLPVDAYLRAVVPGEMPDHFGLTALSAQAVAARSYALAEMQDRGWLWPDTHSQVYRGLLDETRLGDRAVADTRGMLLVHGRGVLNAWFHSTCGGATRPAADVFPYPEPGVLEESVPCDDCRASPFWRWRRELAPERVTEAVGLEPAPLVSVGAEPDEWPAHARRVRVRTPAGEAALDAETFRARVSAGLPRDERLLSTRWVAPPEVEAGVLVVRGAGWGHGVGLCQYGAAGAAARGLDARAILRRYYPGARLVRLQ